MIAFSTKDPKDMTVEELNAEVAKYQQKRNEEDEYLLANPPECNSPLQERWLGAKMYADQKEIEKLQSDFSGVQMEPATK